MSDHDAREFDLESIMDLADIIDALQDTEDDRLLHFGLTATETWDEVDDPVLIGPDGVPGRAPGARATRTTSG